ncbi:MAG: polyribonucleotide nucleotidyltransferase [Alphaproteobacteria bacterium]|nr:polyribonucleotide nucleotidyltransferase [Alphaproteobacteria bacterium]MBQ8631720.1 polyribonucleotide nucleotidyltransferase [Alphaproteobacteria bacterium]
MIDFKVARKEMEWGGRKLVLETGKIARQATGAVIATYGETVVQATVVAAKEAKADQDFFPLTVNYQEKYYATGKVPGGFMKREGKPSEREVLISRLIDRPIRPLFPDAFKNEVQIICTVLSHDQQTDSDIVAMIAASAALAVSGIPFLGPIGAAKVGYKNGQYILNPTIEQMKDTELELSVAGTSEGVLMVESEAQELSEETMLNAVMFGFESFQPVIEMINELKAEAGKEAWEAPVFPAEFDALYERIEKEFRGKFEEAFKETDKLKRGTLVGQASEEVKATIDPENELEMRYVGDAIEKLMHKVVREKVLTTGRRIDGRDTKTVRPIQCEIDVLPKTHGSALFTRGETQALVVTTLGTGEDAQIVDGLMNEYKEDFMLNYNFPPFSVGECGRLGSPGRREIGHGKLAWRAIHPMMPKNKDTFPYTIRVVSEIMESNGSSSMATVCGSTLSLMAAGVPMVKPVAGIAMGLIKEDDGRFSVLTDILGDEDHLGDMDFKVAGTKDGVTALQMDIKITSITKEIMQTALAQAHEGRIHILGEMAKAIAEPRPNVSPLAPGIVAIKIPVDKIREVIGSGGKVIREIVEKTNTKIDISDDGIVKIASMKKEEGDAALEWIMSIVAEPEEGMIYKGVVTKIMDFGAFVRFLGSTEGLVHISEVKNERIASVSDFYKEGDTMWVKCLGTDNRGKIKLSAKRVDQETGADLEK